MKAVATARVWAAFLLPLCSAHGADLAAPLHSFSPLTQTGAGQASNADGIWPEAGLIQGSDGDFYGTAYSGGKSDHGTIFKVSLTGTFTTLYSFSDGTTDGALTVYNEDGAYPEADLVQGSDGDFYGTAPEGGTNGLGTIFKITPTGQFTTLHTFSALDGAATNADGAAPTGSLALGSDGDLYGTALQGGTSGEGVVFKISTAGKFTTLYSFSPVAQSQTNADGIEPVAGLIQGGNGDFYGVAIRGGANGSGTVFAITPNGKLTTLYSFQPVAASGRNIGGAYPGRRLVQTADGSLYGTTGSGGAYADGTLFKVTSGGAFLNLYSFSSEGSGSNFGGSLAPSGLALAADGSLYGTTTQGGENGTGTIFCYHPADFVETLYSFPALGQLGDNIAGAYPMSGIAVARDGEFCGTAFGGGANGNGTVFVFALAPTITAFAPSTGGVGSVVRIDGTNFNVSTTVAFDGIPAKSVTLVSSAVIEAVVPAGAGTGKITVTSPGGMATSATAFTVIPAPVLASFAPASGALGSTVLIEGKNFAGTTAVAFGSAPAAFKILSGGEIQATVPGNAGSGPISVTTPGGTVISAGVFVVIPKPAITSFTPASGAVGKIVMVEGRALTGAMAVEFGGTPAVFKVLAGTTIRTTVPAGAKSGDIVVVTPGGTAVSATPFVVVPAPGLTSFLPAGGPIATSVMITGMNLTGATAVRFGTTPASYIVLSGTEIEAIVPRGAGTGKISVTTSAGTAETTAAFIVK